MAKLSKRQLKDIEWQLQCELDTQKEYDKVARKFRKAKTWPEKIAALGYCAEPLEGQNNWHETAIKEAFGFEVLPELQQFYALGLDGMDHVIYDFNYAMQVNTTMREDKGYQELFMPFGHFFIFGGPGNGDYYMQAFNGDGSSKSEFYLWDHETDNRKAFCSRFDDLLLRHATCYGGYGDRRFL